MALTRAALLSAVAGELADVLTLAGIAATNTAGDLKEPLDRTFRALGVAEADLATATVADGGEARAIAYAVYFTLERALSAVARKMDVTSGTASAKLSQQYDHVKELLGQAARSARIYGLIVAGDGALLAVPYAGGISASDYDAVAADPDRRPLFTVR